MINLFQYYFDLYGLDFGTYPIGHGGIMVKYKKLRIFYMTLKKKKSFLDDLLSRRSSCDWIFMPACKELFS